MTAKPSLLIVEDEIQIARNMALFLNHGGYQTTIKTDGREGFDCALGEPFDLLILDCNLPGMSGNQICRQLRENDCFVPIIMVTAKTTESDRVNGLTEGADDYICKPFSHPELVARVDSMLRRQQGQYAQKAESGAVQFGDLLIDCDKATVTVKGVDATLTASEFAILNILVQAPNKVFSRDEIQQRCRSLGQESIDRAIDTHVHNLRKKLEDNPKNPRYIKTVFGLGYRFCHED